MWARLYPKISFDLCTWGGKLDKLDGGAWKWCPPPTGNAVPGMWPSGARTRKRAFKSDMSQQGALNGRHEPLST